VNVLGRSLIAPHVAAALLGVSTASLRNFFLQGDLPAVMHKGTRWFDINDVIALKAIRAGTKRVGRPTVGETLRRGVGELARKTKNTITSTREDGVTPSRVRPARRSRHRAPTGSAMRSATA